MKYKALPKGKPFEFDYSKQKRLYGYFQTILMSFYSVNIYVDVRHRWKGFGALYCLLLISLLSIPWAGYLAVKGENFYQEIFKPSLEKLPILTINEGELLYSPKKVFIVNNPKTNKAMILIDTSGRVTNLPNKAYPELAVLFTRYAMITKYGQSPVEVQRYGKDMTGDIDQETLKPFFEDLRFMFLAMLYPNLMMLCYGLFYSILAVFAFILKMFSIMLLKHKLNYKQALRLVSVSSTPMMIGFAVSFALGWQASAARWTFFCVFWGYYIFAIRSNKFAARYPLIV